MNLKRHIFVFVLFLLQGGRVYALDLTVGYKGLNSAQVSEKQLAFLCKQFSSLLMAPTIFGPAMVERVRCQKSHKAEPEEFKASNLKLHIEFDDNIWTISLQLKATSLAAKGGNDRFHTISMVKMRHSKKFVSFFTKKANLVYLIHRLLYESPLAAKLDYEGQVKISTPANKNIPPARKLFMVRLLDNGVDIVPLVLAELEAKGKRSQATEYAVYPLDPFENAAGPVYLGPAGPKNNAKAIAKLNKKLQASLVKLGSELIQEDDAFAMIPGVYMGARLGLPLISGDPLLEQSYMVGVFSRVDSGLFKGLTWNWDLAPEVTANQGGVPTKFSWSRASLGWSFGWSLYQGSATSLNFDVTPRLGLMDLDAQLAVEKYDGTSEIRSFYAQNAESFGLEFGFNYQTPWLLFRPWFSSDLAGLLTLGDNTTSISNQRLGLDSYYDLFKIGDSLSFSLFGFGVVERLLLEKAPVEGAEVDASNISELELFFIYAGAGASLKW